MIIPNSIRTMRVNTSISFVSIALLLSACRGEPSSKPAVHPNLNMDYAVSFKPQETNAFFEDGRSMRPPVEGTVARGQTHLDSEYYEGLTADGRLVAKIPVEVTREMILRGKDRYGVFCTPCHGGVGAGDGLVIGYGYVPPQTYHQNRLREVEDGYIYGVIANGIRNMPAYRRQIPVADRWAIVAYVRALQVSQNASRNDLTEVMSAKEIETLESEWRAKNTATTASTDTTQGPF